MGEGDATAETQGACAFGGVGNGGGAAVGGGAVTCGSGGGGRFGCPVPPVSPISMGRSLEPCVVRMHGMMQRADPTFRLLYNVQHNARGVRACQWCRCAAPNQYVRRCRRFQCVWRLRRRRSMRRRYMAIGVHAYATLFSCARARNVSSPTCHTNGNRDALGARHHCSGYDAPPCMPNYTAALLHHRCVDDRSA